MGEPDEPTQPSRQLIDESENESDRETREEHARVQDARSEGARVSLDERGASPDDEHDTPEPQARARRNDIRRDNEVVDEASMDSYPGSDPPAYTGTTAGSKDAADDNEEAAGERRQDE